MVEWLADYGTASERVNPCQFFCANDSIPSATIIDSAYVPGSMPHMIYFWFYRLSKIWKKQPDWLHSVITIIVPFALIIFALALVAVEYYTIGLMMFFLAIFIVFVIQAVPLTPSPYMPGYMVGRIHKWNSMGSLFWGFLLFSLGAYLAFFLFEYYTSTMNSRTSGVSPQGVRTFLVQFLSILALGGPFVMAFTLVIHEIWNDLPTHKPINPVYHRFKEKTPLEVVRTIMGEIGKQATDDDGLMKARMLEFYRSGGAHYQIPNRSKRLGLLERSDGTFEGAKV